MKKPIHTIQKIHKKRKLIIFDLDGTLTESKKDMNAEMAELLKKLLRLKQVAVIGGGKYQLFQRQLLAKLHVPKELLKNLFLFPTTSTTFYRYIKNGWKQVYAENLSRQEKREILGAFEKTFRELRYIHPKKVYGALIEDRGTQVTFSALGQSAPLRLKNKWKKEHSDTKLKIAKALQKNLPNLEVRAAGFTSIDVTRKGIDKEYGIRQIKKHLGIQFKGMLFIGDTLFSGGNDYAVLRTGVDCVAVKNLEDTKKLIRFLIAD